MELILSTIAAGGVVGAADQYLCLLILSGTAKAGLISLSPQMVFMESWFFIAIVAVLWILTVAPAYSTLLSPGVMNVINTAVNIVSGFLSPVSAALFSLASAGVIVGMHPDLETSLKALNLFNANGGIGTTGYLVAGGSAATAVALTGMKALAKPALSTTSGTFGHISAPIFATAEGVASIVIMVLAYFLGQADPWLLVGLLAVATFIIIGITVFGFYQLYRFKRGFGRVLDMAQKRPRAGLAIVVEFCIWGVGWMAWGKWGRGAIMISLWSIWAALTFMVTTTTAIIPVLMVCSLSILVILFLSIGLGSARALLKTLEKEGFETPDPAPGGAA
jgi:hypothetical protein